MCSSDLAADTDAIGIDIMKIEYSGGCDTISEFFDRMRRQFTPNEWKNIRSSADEREQLTAFMRHWTLKEAYVKAVGIGLNLDLLRISFEAKADLEINKPQTTTSCKLDGQPLENWFFEEYLMDSNHVIAIARENHPNTSTEDTTGLTFRMIDFQELIDGQEFLNDAPEEEFVNAYFNKTFSPREFRR